MPTGYAQLDERRGRQASSSRLMNIEKLVGEIKDGIAISEVAERLGAELQASGEQWRSLCLLHDESTPSMYFSDSKQQYHCFGCKAGGDVIDLVEQVRNLSFIESLYWLAAEADIDISERPLTEEEQALERLRDWCEEWLRQFRGVPTRLLSAVAQTFGVTYKSGETTLGLPGYFDQKPYLLNGTILPWRTPSGRLVGWRVREYEGEHKQVRGTPNDFPLGRIPDDTLFGIQVTRSAVADNGGVIVLVEGEYDTMALWNAGVTNVAAMGGSTLTDGQARLLENLHVREAVALFDGDEGGRKAAHAFAEKYWAHDIFFRVAICPTGLDPEDVVKQENGELRILTIIGGAGSALEYLLREEWSARPRTGLTEKLEFVKWIRDSYGQKLRSTDESLVLAEVAKWLEIPELEVRDYVRAADGALCAVDSERLLLGKASRDKRFYLHLRGQLGRDDFFVLKHQRLWDILAGMLIEDLEFDAPTVIAQAKTGGLPEGYVDGLLELQDSNWEYHRGVVADLSLRRSARDDALQFKDRIQDLQQPADLLVGDLTHRITTKALRKAGATQRQLTEQVDEAMETMHERMRNPDEIHGLNLGLQQPRLSRILQGLQSKRLVLVAAISGVGKSTMLCQWAASVAVHRSEPVDLVSLEMDETEILYKIASHMTAIDSTKISGGRLEPEEAQAVEYAMLRIRNSPLHLWCPDGLTGTEFLLYARESVMQRRTRAFFLDYVQLIDPEPGQERDAGYKLYGDFGRLVKMKVARGMDVAMVCAAQLNRGAASKERPTKEDMGDSYALVRHSDVIVILHGEEDSAHVDLWVDKNRQGAGGTMGGLVSTEYSKPTQTFHESGAEKLPEYTVKA